jgi:hypothetical protein
VTQIDLADVGTLTVIASDMLTFESWGEADAIKSHVSHWAQSLSRVAERLAEGHPRDTSALLAEISIIKQRAADLGNDLETPVRAAQMLGEMAKDDSCGETSKRLIQGMYAST